MPSVAIVFVIAFAIVLMLALSWFLAREFYKVARDKGYKERKFFWICFLLGLPGWILVAAMPDGNVGQTVVSSDELPEL